MCRCVRTRHILSDKLGNACYTDRQARQQPGDQSRHSNRRWGGGVSTDAREKLRGLEPGMLVIKGKPPRKGVLAVSPHSLHRF